MFERFTTTTRLVVVDAVREAQRERAPRITDEHLLLALLAHGRAAGLLGAAGLTREVLTGAFAAARRRAGLTDAETEALRSFGIDVDAVVERIEQEHGEGALASPRGDRHGRIPFAGNAKALLANTLQQARERRDRQIGDEHLLLALAAGAGIAAQVLAAHGLSYAEVRAKLAEAS